MQALSPNLCDLLFIFLVFEAIQSRNHPEHSESGGGHPRDSRALLCAREDVLTQHLIFR